MHIHDNTLLYILIGILIVVIGYVYTRSEGFYASPYYTTTFQAYPGKYMNYSSTREAECLQRHQEYPGYRNCMLYFE